MDGLVHKKRKLISFQVISLGFLGVILSGTVFLILPFSSQEGRFTPFFDALKPSRYLKVNKKNDILSSWRAQGFRWGRT